jgi:hypothetical protein
MTIQEQLEYHCDLLEAIMYEKSKGKYDMSLILREERVAKHIETLQRFLKEPHIADEYWEYVEELIEGYGTAA